MSETRTPIAYKVPEIAELLHIGRATAYRLIYTGQIRHIKIGTQIRVPVRALDEFIERQMDENQAQEN